jgi:CRISPR/Cas system CMR-associated protein Cmr3 (group 5 of RAMP superfamily)
MITLQAFKCNDCDHRFAIYVDSKNDINASCEICKSIDVKKIYLPITMRSDLEEQQATTKGEETMRVIEENRFILDRMKQEKM